MAMTYLTHFLLYVTTKVVDVIQLTLKIIDFSFIIRGPLKK